LDRIGLPCRARRKGKRHTCGKMKQKRKKVQKIIALGSKVTNEIELGEFQQK
jgi:hypothetical protein